MPELGGKGQGDHPGRRSRSAHPRARVALPATGRLLRRFEQDGEGALEHALTIVPDIIVTEILVPGLDGLTLCRRLKADPRTRDIAVLVFSILSAAGRAREAGADAFLLKPLAEHTLVGTVQQLLEARSARTRGIQHEP